MLNEEARQSKALEEIALNNKEIVKVLAALNENIVTVSKIFKAWLDEEDTNKDPNQITLDDVVMTRNAVVHTSEFNNPEHRPRSLRPAQQSDEDFMHLPEKHTWDTFEFGDIVQIDEPGSGDHDRIGQVIKPNKEELQHAERLGLIRVSLADPKREADFKWTSLKMVRKIGY